ncbi:hybrid sensor histidine kinase/response regulator [Pacificibacter marinus]|uniref:hybrid sensor histidine kinase/response regulator n=1 Tax=Pacificibacter marinus TaxID=658057 RepID=UPI001C06FC5C|nr:response regulator [Pacificibacter marinus]
MWLLGILLAFAFIALLSFSFWERLEELNTARNDQRGWAYSQLEVEYLKLMHVQHSLENNETQNLNAFRRQFNVFYSRTKLAQTLHLNARDDATDIDDLLAKLDNTLDLIDSNDASLRAQWTQISRLMADIAPLPRRIAIDSIKIHAERAEQQRSEITLYVSWLFYLLIAITLALLLTIFVLSKQSKHLRQSRANALAEKARSDTMLRASGDAVLLINDRGMILDINEAAQELFAASSEELISNSFVENLIPRRHQGEIMENLKKFRETGMTSIADRGEKEFTLRAQDGREFPAAVRSSLVKDGDDNKFVTYFRDITNQKAYEAEILEMRDQALTNAKEKSRFFAIMSHEMRTPLNGVIAALDLLGTTEMSQEQEKYLKAATKSGDVLMEHINDVLVIERLDADETLSLEPLIFSDLISSIAESLKPFADSEEVLLNTHLADEAKAPILSDPRALREIFSNLLSNGVKFSPKGSVTLTTQIEKKHDDLHHMIVKVTDSGIGISNDDLDRIFDDFVSLGDRYEKRKSGTGLGLGIVKRQVERLGGNIQCMSQIGIGSTFVVTLPFTPCEENAFQQIKNAPETSTHTAPMRLLVVDDNAVNRELIEAMLTKMGHEVTLAETGQEAVNICEIQGYDAILMDISMPGISGVEATRLIKAGNGPNKLTAIFAVTANVMAEDKLAFEHVGILATIEKPVRRATIAAALNGVNLQTAASLPASKHIDTQQLQELRDILGLAKMQSRLDAFVAQIEADIALLLTTHDAKDIKTISHSIAGASGMIGATYLHNLCKNLEIASEKGDRSVMENTLKDLPPALTAYKAARLAYTTNA